MDILLTGDDIVKIIRESRKSEVSTFKLGELEIDFSGIRPMLREPYSIEYKQSPLIEDQDAPQEEMSEEDELNVTEYQELLDDPSAWMDRQLNPEKYEEQSA